MHLDRPFGEAAVPVFTWTNQLPFAAQSNQATRALLPMQAARRPAAMGNVEKTWQKCVGRPPAPGRHPRD